MRGPRYPGQGLADCGEKVVEGADIFCDFHRVCLSREEPAVVQALKGKSPVINRRNVSLANRRLTCGYPC